MELPKELSGSLERLSRQQNVTLFMTLLAAFKVLLYKYTGQADILVGTAVAGRTRVEIEPLIGFFVNTLVLRTCLNEENSFEDLFGQVREVVLQTHAHQELPFEKLIEELQPERRLSHAPIFQVMFTLDNSVGVRMELPGLELHAHDSESEAAKFDLTLALTQTENGLVGSVQYNIDLFESVTIQRMIEHYRQLLYAVINDHRQTLASVSLLSEAERYQLLVGWNDTTTEQGEWHSVIDHFEHQAHLTSHAIALVFEDTWLSYGELNARANQLAHYLNHSGIGPEILVGICVERSLEMVIGLFGILKAGAAYVPFDPSYPKNRLEFMPADSGVSLLLTQSHLLSRLPEAPGKRLCLDSEWSKIDTEFTDNPQRSVTPENLVYMIYTSGSTGQPKGALNTHRGLSNRLNWMQRQYQLTDADRVLQKTPFSFDVSVWEFFWPLMTGARLVLASPGGHQDSTYLVQLINEAEITVLHFVPSMLQTFLTEPGVDSCRSLRQVISSGEALTYELQERLSGQLQAQLDNLYGPTEASIDVTFWECQPDETRIVPIGRPIANTGIHILDSKQRAVPIGVIGEALYRGTRLGRGYFHRPDTTAERFIPNPIGPDSIGIDSGGRIYRTGDRARHLADGRIEYLGRIDHQVKVRGFRIELGEIEAVLEQEPMVRQAAVVVDQETGGGARLIAYFVPQIGQTPTTSGLREYLKEVLPEYMIPSVFISLETLPLSPSGKVDRRALPRPDQARPELDTAFILSGTPTEEVLAGIWQEVLGIGQVGVDDNFFELGGHSLLAVQVVSRARRAFGVEVALRWIFEGPTVAGLAETH